ISWEVRTPESILVEPPHLLSLHARYADLVVMTAPDADEDKTQVVRECFTAILFGSGRPVLVVPPHPVTAPVRHLVVAWQPTPEATRALHDAMPLLRQAASVDVVSVDPSVDDLRHGDDPGVDIATHLSRHGLRVNVVALPRAGMSVAEVLLRHAKESGAHCLIAGGYGHSRLREWVLGGTTRELLALARLPVPFSRCATTPARRSPGADPRGRCARGSQGRVQARASQRCRPGRWTSSCARRGCVRPRSGVPSAACQVPGAARRRPR